MVDRRTTASASESHIPEGSCVTATRVPSKPYAGSRMTLIFFPKFLSSMWNMEGGSSCSGIDLTSQNLYNCRFKDKSIALINNAPHMSRFTVDLFLSRGYC